MTIWSRWAILEIPSRGRGDIVQRGANEEAAEQIRKLIEDEKDKLQIIGDEAWSKGLEESRQYLEESSSLNDW
ncbi:uncharacterized protein N7482_001550 [Penicillium canariense]|uniref:Uncharacterized protein n=1 Tax=Penicillium canariense TaxID=189055 RepID=A0A9W9IDL8_9EURO|nr:uncharacterized protein N7482_001550 [Penicillium canariense]KAJ5175673.1 hypothetical protein N7482_001550 [Penicillium canariense]